MEKITLMKSFCAMVLLLNEYNKKIGRPDDIETLLSGLLLYPDGITMDSAFSAEWKDAAKKIVSNAIVTDGIALTAEQAFNLMKLFLKKYNERGFCRDLSIFLNQLGSKYNDLASSAIQGEWNESLKKVLKTKGDGIPETCKF